MISTIIAIASVWMLLNMWLTLIFITLNREFLAGWEDMKWLFISSLISPITLYICLWLSEKWKEHKK